MWVWGMAIGLVVFIGGTVLGILAFLDAQGFGGVLPGFLVSTVGLAIFWGFLLWEFLRRRRT